MAHEDQFTATGPAFTGAGFPRAAFSTGRLGTDSTYGVNVQGSECGVYGECVNTAPRTDRKTPKTKIGVTGVGDGSGVFGRGRAVAGVHGETQNFDAIGVVGVSKDKRRPPDSNASGVGVLGATESFRGFGVVGLSIDSLVLTDSTQLPRPGRDPETGTPALPNEFRGKLGGGTGVYGETGIFPKGALGTSTGVFGVGGTGVVGVGVHEGVHGISSSGIAVLAESDNGAAVVGRSTHGVAGFFNSVDKEALVGVSGGPGNGVRGTAGSGSGVSGESTSGFGVFGDSEKQSGVVGRSRSAVAPGVFGVCEKLTGVAGRSTLAPGVFGDSVKQAGVMGRSFDPSAPGVFGFGDAPFKVLGPPAGVLGLNDNSVGVIGSSAKVIGMLGNTDKGLGVVGVANFGAGVPTDQITDQGIAVIGLGNSGFGAAGLSTSGTGIFGSSKTGLAGHFKGPVMIEGDVTIVGGTKSAAVPHPDGSHRQLYCMESPESWFEDFGEARLVNGKAEVRLDRGFAALVKLKGYHVFLTPYGDCKGMFVTKRAATGFRVCEQQGGTSDVTFAYRVVAKRKDVVAQRLAKVTLPKVSKRLRRPDLRLKIKLPDFKRLSVTPFDLPSTLSKRKKPLGPMKRGNVKAPQYSAKKQS